MSASPYQIMDSAAVIDGLHTALDHLDIAAFQIEEAPHLGIVVRLDAIDVLVVMDALRQSDLLKIEQLIDLFGADIREQIEVTYRLRSMTNNFDLMLKCELPYGGDYHSVGESFASAWLPERELCEMFGLVLHDHPNPKRLLTTDVMPPFLRKEVRIRSKEEIWG